MSLTLCHRRHPYTTWKMVERLARPVWVITSLIVWFKTLYTMPLIAYVDFINALVYLLTTESQICLRSLDGLRVGWLDLELLVLSKEIPILCQARLGFHHSRVHWFCCRYLRLPYNEE